MLDAIHHNAAAAKSETTAQPHASHARRPNYLQCRQCTEQFARRTIICPRCNRVNDRSPFILGIKLLALILFVGTVIWVVRVAAKVGGTSTGAEMRAVRDGLPSLMAEPGVMPHRSSSSADQADVRF